MICAGDPLDQREQNDRVRCKFESTAENILIHIYIFIVKFTLKTFFFLILEFLDLGSFLCDFERAVDFCLEPIGWRSECQPNKTNNADVFSQ